MAQLFMWAFTPARYLLLKLDIDLESILEHNTESHQVGKERGKYKEETFEKMQE